MVAAWTLGCKELTCMPWHIKWYIACQQEHWETHNAQSTCLAKATVCAVHSHIAAMQCTSCIVGAMSASLLLLRLQHYNPPSLAFHFPTHLGHPIFQCPSSTRVMNPCSKAIPVFAAWHAWERICTYTSESACKSTMTWDSQELKNSDLHTAETAQRIRWANCCEKFLSKGTSQKNLYIGSLEMCVSTKRGCLLSLIRKYAFFPFHSILKRLQWRACSCCISGLYSGNNGTMSTQAL